MKNFFEAKSNDRVILITTKAKKLYTDFKFNKKDTLLFGKESAGVPKKVHDLLKEKIKIPMVNKKRSLNLSTSVAIILSESIRQIKFKMEISSKKNIVKNWFVILQDIITNDIEKLENKKNVFKIKNWSRGQNEGGGQFRIFENGKLFEKVGVNFSEVYGKFPKNLRDKFLEQKKIQIFGHQVYQLLCI